MQVSLDPQTDLPGVLPTWSAQTATSALLGSKHSKPTFTEHLNNHFFVAMKPSLCQSSVKNTGMLMTIAYLLAQVLSMPYKVL